jgi:hypothetical protein
MTGFGRLFAGDTCIGHTTHNEENLHTDLEYLNAWSQCFPHRFLVD